MRASAGSGGPRTEALSLLRKFAQETARQWSNDRYLVPEVTFSTEGRSVGLIVNTLANQQTIGWGPSQRDTMAIKNVVIPLEVEYLQSVARERGISRTKLVRVVMQKVIREELVPRLLDDDDLTEPLQPRYRRFRNSA